MVTNKAKRKLGKYIFQCGLATLIVFFILLWLDVLLGPSLVASLGATSFIVFAMPRSRAARPRSLLGSYVIGALVGILCSLVATSSLAVSTGIAADKLEVLFAALAVGLAILAMVTTDTGHPPAAGPAPGLVTDAWDWHTIVFALSAVVFLALVKRLLRNVLMDLA